MALPAVAPASELCSRQIQQASEQLVALVKASFETLSQDVSKRWELIDQLVRPRFDFAYGSELMLDGYWKDASTELQDDFTQAFYEYLVAGFGHLLIDYRPTTLRLEGSCNERNSLGGTVFVQPAILTLNNGDELRFSFLLRQIDGEFLIFDLREGGNRSQVAHFRSQFESELRSEGLEPLVRWLRAESEYLRGKNTASGTAGP